VFTSCSVTRIVFYILDIQPILKVGSKAITMERQKVRLREGLLNLSFASFISLKRSAKREMYFKTTAGKKAVKLMLGETLLKLGYNRTVGIEVKSEEY